MTARRDLVGLLADRDVAADPALRLAVLEILLDVCIHSDAGDCIVRYAPEYLNGFEAVPTANAVQKQVLARKAVYYVDYARYVAGAFRGDRETAGRAAASRANPADVGFYFKRHLLNARLLADRGDYAGAERSIDRVLSLAASLDNPQDDRPVVAWALSEAIRTLLTIGETERALGVYLATAPFIERAQPPLSLDAASFSLSTARLMQETGNRAAARRSLDAAAGVLGKLDVDDEVRRGALAEALALKAVVCAADGDLACAREALAAHPAAGGSGGRSAGAGEEIPYFAARALVGALEGRPDSRAAQVLGAASGAGVDDAASSLLEIYRAAGIALASPSGPTREAGLAEAGRRLTETIAARPTAAFGSWYRPGTIDQMIVALALIAQRSDDPRTADAAFAMFQLSGRRGPSFDTDALIVLAQASDELQRRSIHQALRLRARRDRQERTRLQAVALAGLTRDPSGAALRYDSAQRRTFRDFAARMAAASREPAGGSISVSGANTVSLQRFQASLRPGEAALTVAPAAGGAVAYMCVRRDITFRAVAAADLPRVQADIRVLQAALTAGHAPSEVLDAQFPVASAMRLYDVLIRPFGDCLKPGDHILWLPSLSLTAAPLSVLLERAPPRAGQGYDLAAADWLVRRHAVTYAGSAAMIVAARARRTRPVDFDFLGVGDPILTGVTPAGDDRAKILLRGVPRGGGLASLPPLPETAQELEESARGFRTVRILTGAQATERGLRGQLIGSYRFLSFATHGLMRDDLQGLSDPALVLTPVSATDSGNDGLLTASEIADLNLSARFVALSACNTANFDLSRMSSDLPALASAFMVAGVPATLATLWPVESDTSRRVVAATFAGLRADDRTGAAQALAEAQRAFLAEPPGRAFLHPRFWAPFVVLGDGGAAPQTAPAPAAEVTSVEILTRTGGEVIALGRSDGRVLARFLSDRDAAGRHRAGLRVSGSVGAQAWRRDTQAVGATRFLAELGPRIVAGGYQTGVNGRSAPVLEAFEARSGAPAGTWRGQVGAGLDGFVLAGGPTGGGRAAFIVGELDLVGRPGGAPVRLTAYDLGPDLAPRRLFDILPGAGTRIDDVTLTPFEGAFVVTYTDRWGRLPSPPLDEDDYDAPLCLPLPRTWIELRDARTGRLLSARRLEGVTVKAVLAQDGKLLLGGSVKADCAAEARAAVLLSGSNLEMETRFMDAALGESEVHGLSPMAGGRIFVTALKRNLYDYEAPKTGAVAPAGDEELPIRLSAMLMTLGPDGAATPPRLLDSGSYLLVGAVEASDAADVLLGGSLGDQAAIIHVRQP